MKVDSFTKTYPDGFVLRAPALELERSKICAVIGPNGSGKSTFSRVLAGVLPADAPFSPPGDVGYLPQRGYPFHMSVRANLLLPGGGEARAEELMEALGISHLAGQRADRLSGGELARMALARVLMVPRTLLILDEPTAAMDMEATALAEELLLRTCQETGCALLLVTHSLPQARRLADAALFFHRGTLLESGPAGRVLHSPERPETAQFLTFSS